MVIRSRAALLQSALATAGEFKMSEAYYGGYIGLANATGAVDAEFNSGAFVDTNQLQSLSGPELAAVGYSGVYSGSLSSQGNMVAMQLNTGGLKQTIVEVPGRITTTYITYGPWLTGYFRQYLKDPRQCTFGANSAMPAITGVMPEKYKDTTPGNLLYYIDIQMTRLTGSNTFNSKYFINAFYQALNWVVTSNGYISSLNKAQDTNLSYHGAHDGAQLITSGLNVLAQSNAVKLAIKNQGKMVETIQDGNFGTPNAVAKTLVDSNLGYINNLNAVLLQNGINLQNISSNNYTAIISSTLANITNPSDLDTIQYVVESSIPNITSALDYVSIEKSSGIKNDSSYADMASIGTVLYQRGPISQFTTGQQIYNLLSNLSYTIAPSVENISTQDSLLKPEIVESLRSYLPISADNQPIGIVNVIGMASGYLTSYISLVNEGLARLAATTYGEQISSTLSTLSRYAAKIPQDAAEEQAAAAFPIVPPPIVATDESGNNILVSAGGPDYYETKTQEYQTQYYNILANLVADNSSDIRAIVKQINENYEIVCSQTNLEYTNWMKANLSISEFGDNSTYFGFVSSIPGYAIDKENLGTDTLLYGMAQNNESGDLVKVVMEQAKNASLLSSVNIRPLGLL